MKNLTLAETLIINGGVNTERTQSQFDNMDVALTTAALLLLSLQIKQLFLSTVKHTPA